MKKKFQAKLLDGKIIGPLPLEEILSFLQKHGITGNVLASEFPGGTWQDLSAFSMAAPQVPETPVEKIKTHPDFQEFKFHIGAQPTPKEEPQKKEEPPKKDEFDEETKISEGREFLKEEIDKTRIIEMPKVEEELVEPSDLKIVPTEEVVEKIDLGGQTREFDIPAHLVEIDQEAEKAEVELFKKEETPVAKAFDKTLEAIKTPPKVTRSGIIKGLIGAGIVIYLILEFLKPPAGTIPKIEIIPFTVKFPQTSEFLKEKESKAAFEEGLKLYSQDTYKNKLKAADQFLKSLQFKFQDNPALENLILVYSELLPNSKELNKDASTLFKLIRIGKNKSLSNINIVMGLALFYFHNGKTYTALNIIENYLRIAKPSLKFLAGYLEVLIKVGDSTKAKGVYEKIKGVQFKPVEGYLAVARYLDMDQKFGEGKIEILEGLKNYKNSVPLYLELARYMVRDSQFKQLEQVLKLIENLEAENSPYYFSKYLEYMGILSAVKKDDKKATQFFRSALDIRDSDELRSKLAALRVAGGSAVEALVIESKIRENMRLAQIELKEKRFNEAFQYAIEASDLNPSYIPSQLLLSKVQVERGFYNDALETLKKLKQDVPENVSVNEALVMAYINSYKLDAAKAEITALADTPVGKTPQYYSILARYYLKSGNTILGIKNLQEALDKDPLGDENYFLLATEYLKFRKYGRAQTYLANAIELDPINLEYRSLWAKILYELDSADAALGYLRDELTRNPNNPKILAEMAIYYFKSGQTKNFEDIKNQIESMPKKDASLYKFLVEAAKLEDRQDDILKYSQELIKLFPGDLESRMVIGEYFVKVRNWKDAQKVFEEVKESLGSFPRVNYFLSVVYMAQNQPEKAEESAKAEIAENPSRPGGFYAMGEVLAFKKEFSQAAKMYEKSISIDSKYVDALYALGKIKFKQNYLSESQELFSRAIKESPNYAEIYRDIGFVYKAMGQSGLAIESFETYLKLDPTAKDQDRVKQFIQQLR
jgi:tetratricopeptide (TPR) repeat protein